MLLNRAEASSTLSPEPLNDNVFQVEVLSHQEVKEYEDIYEDIMSLIQLEPLRSEN